MSLKFYFCLIDTSLQVSKFVEHYDEKIECCSNETLVVFGCAACLQQCACFCVIISDLSILLSGLRRRLELMTRAVRKTVDIRAQC